MKLKRSSKSTETSQKIGKSKLKKTKGLAKKAKETVPKYTDLRQVMDYTRPLSIFYSGVEQESYLDILYDLGIRNFLMSYEYLKGKGHGQLKKYPDMHLFIDSGAYTYQNDPKYEEYTEEQWVEQIENYLDWARKHKDQIFAIADLDLQYLSNVGYEKVYEWRKKYFEPFMLETGIPVCFIYHEDGLDVWEYMCKRYPYVGLSLAIDKVDNGSNILREMFRIAEKHNALCQGMASTNTRLLTTHPFYTVDSTTWLVGLKYGEISVWNKTKMSRIKKEDFESKAFPIISTYDRDFDFDLIRQEDTTEMIRVNAYAFVQAERYVRERLKARMYWLKAKTKKVDVDNLPDDFFPSPEWLDNVNTIPEDTPIYAEKMNINPQLQGTTYDCVYDMTILLNWDNPDYERFKELYLEEDGKLITELHDTYVNRIVSTLDEKIDDLIAFYRSCLSGENDKLLQMGTNFDRMVKEREEKEYVNDEEYDLVDVPEMEINNLASKFLPPPKEGDIAPEISELDDEIFKEEGIVPIRDESGKFLKGQRKVLKPKKLYSKKFPKLACDTCFNAQKCPEYKAGYVCAYNKMFERFNTRDMGDVIQAMQGIVDFSLMRLQRGMITEVLEGGLPNGEVSGMMNQTMSLLNQLQRMYEYGSREVIKQTTVLREDGTQETTTQVSNPQSTGILAKIFGDLKPEDKEEREMIETTAVEAEDK